MPLVINNPTHAAIPGGQAFDVILQAALTSAANVAHSATGHALLHPILTGAGYTITIKDSGKTATLGQSVTINTRNCNAFGATTPDGLKEMIDSAIFELTNAKNHVAVTANEANLLLGTLPIRTYGTVKATIEAEATWNVAHINAELQHSQQYVPSQYGLDSIAHVGNYANLGLYTPHFLGSAHNPRKPGTVDGLHSEEMYAFRGAVILATKDNGRLLDVVFNALSKTPTPPTIPPQRPPPVAPRRILLHKLGQEALKGDWSKVNTTDEVSAGKWFHVLIECLTTHQDLTVTFHHGVKANWEFTNAMKLVAPDHGWATAINNALSNQMTKIT
jgi:hypothetical protein